MTRLRSVGAILLVVVALACGQASGASAAPDPAQTYAGPSYSSQFTTAPTRAEDQSKLWFHDGSWFALMADPKGNVVRVGRLMPDHSWQPTPTVVNPSAGDVGDALQAGDVVHVVAHRSNGNLVYVRLTWDPASNNYRASAPVQVSGRVTQGPATIAADASGRLWVGFATAATVLVFYSDDGGATWSQNNALFFASTGVTAQISRLIAFDDKVGIIYSDQPGNAFKFAWHRDGDIPTAWTRETVFPGQAAASSHVDIVRVPGPPDTLVAIIKTARGDHTEPADSPMFQLLTRTPDGRWSASPISTVGDRLNEPVLQLDLATRSLYLFATAPGGITAKRTSLSDLRFGPGPGETVVLNPSGAASGSLVGPSVSKDPADARSGIVVLASDTHDRIYRHAELPLVPATTPIEPGDKTPPTVPGAVQAQATSSRTVVLSWTPSIDGTQWVPAHNGVPVAGYVVSRNGRPIATVTGTSFQDQPRGSTADSAAATVSYSVQAVDASGNKSDPARVVAVLPAASGNRTSMLVGALLGILAALLALVVIARVLLLRYRLRPERRAPVPPSGDAGVPPAAEVSESAEAEEAPRTQVRESLPG